MVALYFNVFPGEEDYYQEVIEAEENAEEKQAQLEKALIEYVGKMKKADLRQALLQTLFEGPEWQFERFVRENFRDYDG